MQISSYNIDHLGHDGRFGETAIKELYMGLLLASMPPQIRSYEFATLGILHLKWQLLLVQTTALESESYLSINWFQYRVCSRKATRANLSTNHVQESERSSS